MAVTTLEKGKGRARPEDIEEDEVERTSAASASSEDSDSSDSDSDSDSSSDDSSSDSDSDSESGDEVTQEFLDSLLERARQNARAKVKQASAVEGGEEEFIHLGSDDEDEAKKEKYVQYYGSFGEREP